MVKWILGRLAFLSVCLLFVSVSGLQAQTTFSFDVDVSCQDTELRSLVRSFFSRELHELGDVRVTATTTPDYRVEVIAFKIKRTWTMSVVITAPFFGSSATGLDTEKVASLEGYTRVIGHSLTKGDSTGDLDVEIGGIVRTLNTEVLKPRRKELKRK